MFVSSVSTSMMSPDCDAQGRLRIGPVVAVGNRCGVASSRWFAERARLTGDKRCTGQRCTQKTEITSMALVT